jgi:hypothetical protein
MLAGVVAEGDQCFHDPYLIAAAAEGGGQLEQFPVLLVDRLQPNFKPGRPDRHFFLFHDPFSSQLIGICTPSDSNPLSSKPIYSNEIRRLSP